LTIALITRVAGAESDYVADAEKLLAKGDLRAAEIQLKNAVRSDPKNMAAHYRLAVIELQLGNAAAADHDANFAQEPGYDAEHTVPHLAQTYLAQQKYKQLLEEFTGEGGSPGERAGILVARGYAQLALGSSEEARQSFAEAQRLAPEDARPALAEAKLLVSQRQFAKAESLFDRALALDPKSREAQLGKAQVLRFNEDLDKALT